MGGVGGVPSVRRAFSAKESALLLSCEKKDDLGALILVSFISLSHSSVPLAFTHEMNFVSFVGYYDG